MPPTPWHTRTPKTDNQRTKRRNPRGTNIMAQHLKPKLHNAMWPGLVGKGTDPGQEPPISLERMLELTASASVNGQKFEGIDYFLFLPHTDPNASDVEIRRIADLIQSKG